MKIGDLFKSYDFSKELRPDTYMFGIVKNITEGGFIEATIVKQVFAGELIERPPALDDHLFRTPMQGLGMFDDRDTRIELVATAEEIELLLSEGCEFH